MTKLEDSIKKSLNLFEKEFVNKPKGISVSPGVAQKLYKLAQRKNSKLKTDTVGITYCNLPLKIDGFLKNDEIIVTTKKENWCVRFNEDKTNKIKSKSPETDEFVLNLLTELYMGICYSKSVISSNVLYEKNYPNLQKPFKELYGCLDKIATDYNRKINKINKGKKI